MYETSVWYKQLNRPQFVPTVDYDRTSAQQIGIRPERPFACACFMIVSTIATTTANVSCSALLCLSDIEIATRLDLLNRYLKHTLQFYAYQYWIQ